MRAGARRGPALCGALAAIFLAHAASALGATAPALVGSISDANTMSGATAVAVSGQYAFTTAYWSGRLVAVDISNPASPTISGSTGSSSALTAGSNVNIAGNYAFVASKNRNASSASNDDGTGNSLTVVDISTPTSPTIVGSVQDPAKLFGAYGVAVSGHYAFLAYQGLLSGQPTSPDTSSGGFSVIDLNNLSAGVVANIDNGSLPSPWTGQNAFEHATSVAISGNYAYVTAFYAAHLTVVDISNPTSPKIVASIGDWPRLAYDADVAVSGKYAYVADQQGGTNPEFAIVNISNPTRPSVVGSISNGPLLAGAYRVRVRGNFAYVSASSAATVAAIDVSNPAAPRIAGSVTDSAHLNSTTGLDLDSTGRYLIGSSPKLSTEVAPKYPPYPLQSGGPTNTGTISAIDLDPVPISVTIAPSSEPPNPTTQTSASFSFSVSDAVSSVRCRLDNGAFGLCTSPTTQQYASLASGSHTFTVQATDAAGNSATDSYTWTVGTTPQNTAAPTISGTAAPGHTLTASTGTWSGYPAPTFTYQWQRCDQAGQNCNPISGATNQTYSVQTGDDGSTLTVTVTGTNSLGSGQATSAAVGPVTDAPANTTPPSITGSAAEAQTLNANSGAWSGYPAPTFSYQWQRCDQAGKNCVAIQAATNPSYTLLAADVGSTAGVVVTATNTSGSAQAASAASAVVASAPGPVTSLLDDFNRADNGGPPSSNWTHTIISSSSASNNLLISSQQVTGMPGSNGDYWNPQAYGPNSEVWLTVATKPSTDLDPVVLGLRFQNPALASASGYQAFYIFRSSGSDQYKITSRVNGNPAATLASATGPTLNPGDQLLFRAIGTTLELWRGSAGVWTRLLTASDSTFTGAGYLLVTTRNNVVRLDNFGGGTLP